ncbi:putative SWI/SNF-related matrix-associated actin-dependent regulator of chromatin subfamily A member 3-like 1 [Papaver somniferum]|uniref:putative SWI/SNF-related matrix-associated actin-dependent regulator of chromatin subfamily A member 3-like 1 n=1 Tax=Papaver somniferum TaxID=3469 RepID=UPI000E6F51D8|nr:putative SWI/SNF-related matrix-associated actin-dependent regulator of chromatin subfamily A member 3-like 1 [Papaver somniferum]
MMAASSSTQEETYLLGFVTVNIVGLQHYFASVKDRQVVGLLREPFNSYDENAIKVLDVKKTQSQVGYIERSAAAILSPLIDTRQILVQGIVPKTLGVKNRYKKPCQVHIFAKIEDFETVKSVIMESGLQLISGSNPAFTQSESAIVKELQPKKKFKKIDEVFNFVSDSEKEKGVRWEALEPPKQIIKTELLDHQKLGLGWLVHRENSDELPPFWIEKEGEYGNLLTDFYTRDRPAPLRGGIFADDMGLGKTLTLLSLIATNRPDNTSNGSLDNLGEDGEQEEQWSVLVSGNESKKRKQILKTVDSNKKRRTNTDLEDGNCGVLGPRTTLVVCPTSVFSTWVTQLNEHTRPGHLKVYMYYGTRTNDPEELQKYDIVLTTYGTLASEFKNSESPVKKVSESPIKKVSESPISKVEWFRVILDEAHVIKNEKSSQAVAVLSLKALRRWVVTGTPILNGAYDLYSLVAFLKFEPLSVKSYWQTLVQQPLDKGQSIGLSRLQNIMASLSLRRHKDDGLVELPPKTVETCLVELSVEERDKYDQMLMDYQNVVRNYIHRGSVVLNYSRLLSIVLRLRQICNDVTLCPTEELLPSYNIEDVSSNPELLQKLVSILQDGDDFDCPICISPPTGTIITCCAHIFCKSCILKAIQKNSFCPLCRHSLSESDLFSAPPEESSEDCENSDSSNGSNTYSSKVSALLKLLIASRNENPSRKSVVFSQFRKMLVLLERPLKDAGFKILRLDGSMTATRRGKVIKEFENQGSDSATVLLASLKASGTGINLTAASRVYLFEPWWNPAVEEQAMDRVHRIGQKEDVKIVRLIVANSIEERILELQSGKKNLGSQGSRKNKDMRQMGGEDILLLLDL